MNSRKNVHFLKYSDDFDIESSIRQYDEINRHIKTLETEKSKLKEFLINNYFHNHKEYRNKNGIILATYLPQTRSQLKTTDFKRDHPELCATYTEEKTIFTLVIK